MSATEIVVTEGACLDGVHVLTQAELNRIIAREKHALSAELRIVRNTLAKIRSRHGISRPARGKPTYVPATPHAADARRATYRSSTKKRYARYLALIEEFGEPRRGQWWVHLAELDRRVADTAKGRS